MYVGPVRKLPKGYKLMIGKDKKRKKFHVVCVLNKIPVRLPPPHIRAKITEMGFDFSFGIKADTIAKVYAEIQELLEEGYTEEEAPPMI